MQPELARFQRDFARSIEKPAKGALAVYRNTVIHGAVEALRANYPAVEQILGADMFEHVAVDFAAEFPPRTPVLALYGADLGEWLERQPWTGELPYLADVAKVERLHVESLMASDEEPLDREATRHFMEAGAPVVLHPSARFHWLRSPGMSIWLAHQRPLTSPIEPEWKAEGALFVRPSAYVMHALRIGAAAHRILCGVRIGERLGDSLSAASRLYPEENCTAVLASLVNLGVFVAPAPERN